MAAKPQYQLATDSDFDNFIRECESADGWEEVLNNPPARVCRKKSSNSAINILRVATVFPNLNPEILYDVLHDHQYRTTWDTNMIEGRVVEQLDHHNEIGYYAARSPPGVSNRDFLNQRSWRPRPETGEYVIFNHSVTHPECPERGDFVRAQSLLTGYLIRRTSSGGSSFTYMTQSDPKGWIPAWVINSLMTKLGPKLLDNLFNAATQYEAWKSQNNPTHKPWRT
eukprot:TRINITY_DN9_c0_g1_i1.p1 TRINITY_DN9_c0_g1~~TRINITY_DN9_c0_g1_i1.p1  ORF type:complete len:225 (-),score=111.87 TRINITY_DN9_c0_g1_i1:372-1046(-)